jgi:hypothetical protein
MRQPAQQCHAGHAARFALGIQQGQRIDAGGEGRHPFDAGRRHAAGLADSEAVEHEHFMARREGRNERRVPVVERSTKPVEQDEPPAGTGGPGGNVHAVDDDEFGDQRRGAGHFHSFKTGIDDPCVKGARPHRVDRPW